jgi:hypothetical protein
VWVGVLERGRVRVQAVGAAALRAALYARFRDYRVARHDDLEAPVMTKSTAIGYVRVSRVGGRVGDSLLSLELQRQSIERVCQREGLTLVDVLEELDKAAETRIDRSGTMRSSTVSNESVIRDAGSRQSTLAEPRRPLSGRRRWPLPAGSGFMLGRSWHRERVSADELGVQ